MIIVLNQNAAQEDIEKIKKKMVSLGCEIHEFNGTNYHIIGLVGDTSCIDPSLIEANRNVEQGPVQPVPPCYRRYPYRQQRPV